MDQMKSISFDDIAAAQKNFESDRAHTVAKNAATSAGVRKAARVPEGVALNPLTFDVEVKQGDRTNQKRSGRCWMFASLNTFRYRIIKKYNLSTFELSQAYPLFWDKMEKSNWFLENILDTLNEPLNGRLVSFLLTDPIGDGGQWDMFKSLVKKYGVVPKSAMPETECSSNTHEMDTYLTRYLRSAAKRLRETAAAGESLESLREMKKEMMEDVYTLLVTCLGQPPVSFEARLRDKDDNLVLSGTFTPQEFFAETVDMNLDDYISIISAPTADKPFNLPVWFGCDVAQSYLREEGIMDTRALDVDGLFGFPVEGALNRAERLDYGESLMTHAMVLEGVNFDAEGNTTLWKVENSWGKDHGRDGFDTISDPWFDEYVYQIVVDKKYLTPEQLKIFETEEATILEPWDPMGSLATLR